MEASCRRHKTLYKHYRHLTSCHRLPYPPPPPQRFNPGRASVCGDKLSIKFCPSSAADSTERRFPPLPTWAGLKKDYSLFSACLGLHTCRTHSLKIEADTRRIEVAGEVLSCEQHSRHTGWEDTTYAIVFYGAPHRVHPMDVCVPVCVCIWDEFLMMRTSCTSSQSRGSPARKHH